MLEVLIQLSEAFILGEKTKMILYVDLQKLTKAQFKIIKCILESYGSLSTGYFS